MKRLLSILTSAAIVAVVLLGMLAVLQPRVSAAPLDITPIGTARLSGAGWSGSLQGNVTVPPNV